MQCRREIGEVDEYQVESIRYQEKENYKITFANFEPDFNFVRFKM